MGDLEEVVEDILQRNTLGTLHMAGVAQVVGIPNTLVAVAEAAVGTPRTVVEEPMEGILVVDTVVHTLFKKKNQKNSINRKSDYKLKVQN